MILWVSDAGSREGDDIAAWLPEGPVVVRILAASRRRWHSKDHKALFDFLEYRTSRRHDVRAMPRHGGAVPEGEQE
jgi:hypothetical protein